MLDRSDQRRLFQAQMLADPNRGSSFHPARAALWAALLATRAEPSAAHDAEAERAFAATMREIPVVSPWTLEELCFLHRVDLAYAYADRVDARPSNQEIMEALFSDTTRPMRADPRFMTLAARLGLVAIWRATDQWPDFCSDSGLGYDCRVEAARALSESPRPLVAQR